MTRKTFFLSINTATAKTAVALLENTNKPGSFKTVFFRNWESKRNEAEKLIPQIKIALKKGSPDKIFAVCGPGAFTALRIGVTVANTLGYIYKAPIIPCPTTDFLTLSVPENIQKNTAIILKAGGEFVAVKLPSSKKLQRIEKKELEKIFAAAKTIKFIVSDMSAGEQKKCRLPAPVKWLPESKIIPFNKVAGHFIAQFSAKKIRI